MKPLFWSLLMITIGYSAEDWQTLWPQNAPGASRPPAGTEKVQEGGRLTDIETPQYLLFQPEPQIPSKRAAVVIFPGGGYTILASDHEGRGYARWLTARGYTAIVVKYRVSGKDELGYQYPVPFLDARRAIRTVRSKAAEWKIDPNRIGVMGSSAGGHLASLCATRFSDSFPQETQDSIDAVSCRPDFAILVYPVIAMDHSIGHSGSRRRLLGANPTAELADQLSTHRAVSKQTPPCFLLTTADDGVDCRNSLEFAAACRVNRIPAELHLFPVGGHGYGLDGKTAPKAWPGLLETWLNTVTAP